MKMQTVYMSYFNLTPNFENKYFHNNHSEIIKILREQFPFWKGIFDKYGDDFSIGFMVTRKKGTEILTIKGPSVSKKMKIVDFSLFLPDEIKDLNHYIDLVFEGVGIVLQKYGVQNSAIEEMKNECKKELEL